MAEAIGRFKPGENLPGFCTEQIPAGRACMIAGDKTPQGDYSIKLATANIGPAELFGVSQRDSGPTTDPVTSWTRRVEFQVGGVAYIKAAAAIPAGKKVFVSGNGEVKEWESGKEAIGVTVANAASGALAEIKPIG